MICSLAQPERRTGAAIVEFAIVSPLLLVMLIGLWEVGRMVEAQQVLNNAAREGARQGSTGQRSLSEVQDTVTNYLTASGFNTSGVVVTVTNVTKNTVNGDPRTYDHLDHFKIDVSMPFSNVRWILLDRFDPGPSSGHATISPPSDLQAVSHWYSMRDTQLTVSFTPPIE